MGRLSPYEMYGLFKETLQECSSEVLDLSVEQSFRLETVKEAPEFKRIVELSDEILSLLTY